MTDGPRPLAQNRVHNMSLKLAACQALVLGNAEAYLKRDPSGDGFVSCQWPVEGVTVPGCVASMGLLVKCLISIHSDSLHLHQVEDLFNPLSAVPCRSVCRQDQARTCQNFEHFSKFMSSGERVKFCSPP